MMSLGPSQSIFEKRHGVLFSGRDHFPSQPLQSFDLAS